MPWSKVEQIREHTKKYVKAARHFIQTHKMKVGKIMRLRLEEVACIKKGKVSKDNSLVVCFNAFVAEDSEILFRFWSFGPGIIRG